MRRIWDERAKSCDGSGKNLGRTDKSEEKLTFVTRFVGYRHKFSRGPSTFFKKKGDVASRFVSSIPGEEFGQDLRESEPGDLLPGSGRKKQFSLNF